MKSYLRVCFVVLGLQGLFACTRPNAAICHDDQCIDPEAPFCDIDGVIGGTPGRCIAVECVPDTFAVCRGDTALVCNAAGTSYDRLECQAGCASTAGCQPFCTPGEVLSCAGDQLTTCRSDGAGTTVVACSLGCAAGASRCKTFEPSNGLGPALTQAASEPDVVFPSGTRINTDLAAVQDANGTSLPVRVLTVTQVGASSIVVLVAKSFSTADLTVTGSKPLALVADGPITIRGRLSARAFASTRGPGAQFSAACNGGDAKQYACSCTSACSTGAGGAGNAQLGGRGGASSVTNAGGALTTFSPLAGGCSGGDQLTSNGLLLVAEGGGGGGSVQLVSATKVALEADGLIDVGGGGGQSTAGGGAGGLVVVEAPELTMVGPGAGVVANGGAGGGCGMSGPDGRADSAQAPGPVCANYFGGSGGTPSRPPGNGCIVGVDSCQSICPVVYGGGGGAAGRMRIATRDGAYGTSGNPVVSVQLTTETLDAQ